MCEQCEYFFKDDIYRFMDCTNENIDQDNYFNHLGEGKPDCPYFKKRNDDLWMQD